MCTVTKQPLFSEESWKKARGILDDIQKGWVSDPLNIPIYVHLGTDKHGLNKYCTLRGTNNVEGFHKPIRTNFASLNASPILADCVSTQIQYRDGCNQWRGQEISGTL